MPYTITWFLYKESTDRIGGKVEKIRWEVMHAALLLGYGASAINPYMVFAILDDMVKKGDVRWIMKPLKRTT